jgi:hypothetical protein
MTRRSERELRNDVDELQGPAGTDISDSEAYALLVGAASGDETAAKRWAGVDTGQRERLTADL